MKITNCGVVALEKLNPIEKISAYSLIQMAKDNGMNLLIYQVDVKDLVRVPRPVIIHAKDHFFYVKNGDPLPDYPYTGFVLAQKGFAGARVVPHVEAKQILGSKKGGVLRHIVPAVLAFVPVIGPELAAVANIGMDQYAKSNHPEQLGEPGKPFDIIGAGVSGYLQGVGAQGATAGFKAAGEAANATLGSKLAGGLQGAFNAASHPIASNPLLNAGGQVGANAIATAGINGGGLAGQTAAFNQGTSSVLSGNALKYNLGSPAMSLASGGVGNAAGVSLSGIDKFVGAIPGFSTKGLTLPGSLTQSGGQAAGNILASNMGTNLLALGASQFGKPDTSALDNLGQQTADSYNTLKTYIGQNSLVAPTQEQLLNYINTPIDQLTKTMTQNSGPVIDQINKSFDQQIQNAQRQFAQAGQDFRTSSDARDTIQKINNDRAQAIQNATIELQNRALSQAVQAKQYALSQGITAGQFDMQLAMDLATLTGQGKALQASIQQNNYNSFQNIIANLLHMGYTQQQPVYA